MIMTKDDLLRITQNISPEQAEYVSGIKSVCNDAEDYKLTQEETDNLIYVTKLLAFTTKFKALHWAAMNMSYHKALGDFYDELDEYTDAISENIQGVTSQFTGRQFTALTLPLSDNPLEVINELKQCVSNWLQSISTDPAYEGCRNATSGFMEVIYKYTYLFRLCKPDSRCDY